MPNITASLPAGAFTSTTGQGLAAAVATLAGAGAAYFTSDMKVIGAVSMLAGAITLIVFPQRAAAPGANTAAAVSDLATALPVVLKAIQDAEAAKTQLAAGVVAKPVAAAPAAAPPAPPA